MELIPNGTNTNMEKRTIRVQLNEDHFRKFKVYCAINDISMTDQINKLVFDFIQDINKEIKIVNTKST